MEKILILPFIKNPFKNLLKLLFYFQIKNTLLSKLHEQQKNKKEKYGRVCWGYTKRYPHISFCVHAKLKRFESINYFELKQ